MPDIEVVSTEAGATPPPVAERHDFTVVARDLVKEYRQGSDVRRALQGVSIEVERGAFVAIMGPSGSGKSTLLHLLGALDSPTAGEIELAGRRLSGLSDRELTLLRRDLTGFVFQAFNLVPVLSVRENIALPGVIAGDGRDGGDDERVAMLLDLVRLTDHAAKTPNELSGGEQQRVAIARSLVRKPAVILADEPTGNLDSRTGREVLATLDEARRVEHTTVIMVTHDPRMAAFADSVVFLEDGAAAGTLSLADATNRGDRAQRVLQER